MQENYIGSKFWPPQLPFGPTCIKSNNLDLSIGHGCWENKHCHINRLIISQNKYGCKKNGQGVNLGPPNPPFVPIQFSQKGLENNFVET